MICTLLFDLFSSKNGIGYFALLGDHERQAEVAEVCGINQWGDGNGGRGHVHSGEFQKGEQGYGEFSVKKEI